MEHKIVIDTTSSLHLQEISEIVLITYLSCERKIQITTSDLNVYSFKSSFNEFSKKFLDEFYFFKLDRGTVVNLHHIKAVDFKEEQILCTNNLSIYSSKKKLKELKDEILKYSTQL
nr:LytTR family transcriptional regulator DNA-binding domain-containing protein [uncultured Cetobacterium sp.]